MTGPEKKYVTLIDALLGLPSATVAAVARIHPIVEQIKFDMVGTDGIDNVIRKPAVICRRGLNDSLRKIRMMIRHNKRNRKQKSQKERRNAPSQEVVRYCIMFRPIVHFTSPV